jgi:pimeloyl-ACP methyl ester carboxylesterase
LGRNDFIFPKEGAIPYQRDLKNIEVHLLNTEHFALEEEGELIAELISHFLITTRHNNTISGYSYNIPKKT